MIEVHPASRLKSIEDKEQIKKVIYELFDALCAKDVKKMMVAYADDVIVFDAKPPFQTKGAVAWRHTGEACMPYFPEQFTVEIKDLHIHARGEIAIAHWMFGLQGAEKDHDAMQTWMRATTGYKKLKGNGRLYMSMAPCRLIHTPGKLFFH